jgi:thiamine pyrophosphate-dependent acetolactate synthase large subunit-like protein
VAARELTHVDGLDRRAATAQLVSACPDALVVSGLGSASYDLFAAGDRSSNFYLWGAMGGAAAMGLGLALAQPRRPVLVLTGDGEQLMGIGALATIGVQAPANLAVVVLDNGRFAETGMQRSHTALGVSLPGVAAACGFAWTLDIGEMEALAPLGARIQAMQGCGLARIIVRAEELPRALPSRDGVWLKNRFRSALGFPPM